MSFIKWTTLKSYTLLSHLLHISFPQILLSKEINLISLMVERDTSNIIIQVRILDKIRFFLMQSIKLFLTFQKLTYNYSTFFAVKHATVVFVFQLTIRMFSKANINYIIYSIFIPTLYFFVITLGICKRIKKNYIAVAYRDFVCIPIKPLNFN